LRKESAEALAAVGEPPEKFAILQWRPERGGSKKFSGRAKTPFSGKWLEGKNEEHPSERRKNEKGSFCRGRCECPYRGKSLFRIFCRR
jgi:hypothetical protein